MLITRKCRECGNAIDMGHFCPRCIIKINNQTNAVRVKAQALGLIETHVLNFQIPNGYYPVGYQPEPGHIGFKVEACLDYFMYREKTWDCPEGLSACHELTGIMPVILDGKGNLVSVPECPVDNYGNSLDGEEDL